MNFKERICDIIIQAAQLYQSNFIDCEYLIYSDGFQLKEYYLISSEANNFLHLTGINSSLSPEYFYKKSLSATLKDSDFDFVKTGQCEKSVKGSVRRKIKILPEMMTLMNRNICAEEQFRKNKVYCSLATSDGSLTLGFIDTGTLRPKSLLYGNELNNSIPITLILKRCKGTEKFDTLVNGRIGRREIMVLGKLLGDCFTQYD